MKTALLLAASLLLPASLFADVAINVRFSTGDFTLASSAQTMNYYDDNEYISIDEPWFEDIESIDNARVSYEYQWTNRHGSYVLVYRRVNFLPYNNSWAFGPWSIRSGVSYATYQHRRPVSNSSWNRCRSNNGGAVSYYYEYREPQYRNTAPRVYQYNYEQPRRVYHYNNEQPRRRTEQKHNRYTRTPPPASARTSTTTMRKSSERAPVIAEKRQVSRSNPIVRGSNNSTVVRVTQRERIR